MPIQLWDGVEVTTIGALLRSRRHAAEVAYLMRWIKNPDPGSVFERKSRWIRKLFFSWAPARLTLWALTSLGYNGFLFTEEGTVVGHVFYQRHGAALHMFSVSVAFNLEGRGRATEQLRYFVHAAHAMPETTAIRLGAGGHAAVRRMVEKIGGGEVTFPFSIRMEDGGWIHFNGKI